MKIPHKSQQKEGWLYWDMDAHVAIFIKGKLFCYCRGGFKIGDGEYLVLNPKAGFDEAFFENLKEELYLTGHFPLFNWNMELKVRIPPPPIIEFPVMTTEAQSCRPIKYRLSHTTITDAFYLLHSKVTIKVE